MLVNNLHKKDCYCIAMLAIYILLAIYMRPNTAHWSTRVNADRWRVANASTFALIRRRSGGRQVASASPGGVSAEVEAEASWLAEQERRIVEAAAAADLNTNAAQLVEASWLAEQEARVAAAETTEAEVAMGRNVMFTARRSFSSGVARIV